MEIRLFLSVEGDSVKEIVVIVQEKRVEMKGEKWNQLRVQKEMEKLEIWQEPDLAKVKSRQKVTTENGAEKMFESEVSDCVRKRMEIEVEISREEMLKKIVLLFVAADWASMSSTEED